MKIKGFITICGMFCIAAVSHATEQKVKNDKVPSVDVKKAEAILDKKCTVCHSKDKINIALSSGKDMNAIQKQMEKKGAHLTSNERDVLGIFWKQSKPISK